jgi:ribose transport system ATP-binding protein
MNGQPILTLEKISKSFGPVQVIDEVTVSVHPGKVQVLSAKTVPANPR